MWKKSLLVVFAVVLYGFSAFAQQFPTIGADEVKKLIDGKKNVVIVDARTETEFREGHLPTAINIPPEKLSQTGNYLPKSKNTPLVFYCRGVG